MAELVYGDGSRKNEVSKIENGKVQNPHEKTVDLYTVALDIDADEIASLRAGKPPPNMVDTLVDFFEVSRDKSLYTEIAVHKSGKVAIFHDCPLKVEILRVELFVSDRQIIWVTKDHRKRSFGSELKESIVQSMSDLAEVYFIRLYSDKEWGEPVEYPLLVIN